MELTKVLMNDIFNSKGIITIAGKHDVGKSCFVANIVKNLATDFHTDKTQTIESEFNAFTGEFT